MSWTNSDGLFIKIGTEEGKVAKGGSYCTCGPLQISEVKIDLTNLATGASIAGSENAVNGVIIPSGVRIEEVEVIAETAATSGGSAALNVGLIRLDRSTELDYDGLVAALALTAIDTAQEKNVIRKGSTGAGALIGTTTANAGILTADYDTAAFTAGKIIIRVAYYKPQTSG